MYLYINDILSIPAKLLYEDLLDCQKENQELRDKINTYEEVCKKLRQERDENEKYKSMFPEHINALDELKREIKDLKKLLRESYNQIKEICDNMNLTAYEDLLKSIEDGLSR
jgi:DNA repair exonuclease SbcCD ATPase subunit